MKSPNFIIAGCGKAGTTSLQRYLHQHPDVFMTLPKEPRYFFHPETRPDFCGPMDEDRSSIWKISRNAIPDTCKDLFKRKLNKKVYPCMPIKTRKRLVDIFEETIQRVSEITERDLSHWLVVPSD